MPKSKTNYRTPKSPELIAAEQAGKEALRKYFYSGRARQKEMEEKTGMLSSALSRMANKDVHINLDAAVMMEVASCGELRAEVLCPERADVLREFLQLREADREA